MRVSNVNNRFYILIWFLFLIILNYAVQDFLTSENVMWRSYENRQGVYASLLALLIVLGMFYAGTMARGLIAKSHFSIRFSVTTALWLITGWIGFVNYTQSASVWSSTVHLGLSFLWLLSYHFFSYYLRRWPGAWPQIQACISILFVFYVLSSLYAAYNLQMLFDRIVVVNLAYNVLVFLPWISLMAAKKWRILGVGLVLLVLAVSMKRGALIVFPLMFSASILVGVGVRKKGLQAVLKFIFVMVILFGGLVIADQRSGGFLRERFMYEQLMWGSGRDQIYSRAFDDIVQRTPWEMLLGRGSGASVQYLGTGVHNEWLEFLFSFGVTGALFYALLFLALIRRLRQLIRNKSPYAMPYAMAVAYMFVVGMYGGIYFVHSTLYIMSFYGAIDGLMYNDATIYARVRHADLARYSREGAAS